MKEELTKFYQKYRIFIFPAVVAISSLFLIVFAIIPQISKLIDNQKAVNVLAAKSDLLEAKAATLENYDNEDLTEKVQLVLRTYPADKDPANILGFLQQLVTSSGFSVTSISPSSSSNKLVSGSGYSVRIEVIGTKALFENLLDNLENSARLLAVSSIDIAESGSQLLNATLELEVLYANVPTTYGTDDSPLPKIKQQDETMLAKLAKLNATTKSSEDSSSMIYVPRGKSNPFE